MSDDEKENFVYEEILGSSKDSPEKQNAPLKRSLTFYESIKKGPIEKYLKHGVFPWKFIICLLLVVFTICQVVLIVGSITTYNRSQVRGLYNLFIDDSDKLNPDYNRVVYLYSLEELKDHIKFSVNNYYSVKNLTLDDFEYLEGNPNPVIEFRYLDNKIKKVDNNLEEMGSNSKERIERIDRGFYYPIDQNSLGPFDKSDELVKEFINDVVDFKINYTLVTKYPYMYEGNFECNQWEIVQTYSFSSRAHFICKLDILDQICAGNANGELRNISWSENFIDRLLWIHLIVLSLAIFSLFFTFRSIYTFVKMYVEAKKRLKKRQGLAPEKMESASSDDSIYFNPLFDSGSDGETEESENKSSDKNLQYESNVHNYKPVTLDTGNRRKESLFARGREEYLNNNNDQLHPDRVPDSKKKGKKYVPKKHFLFLQFWSTFIIIGNFLQILGACLALNNNTEVTTVVGILIGSGCLFACISTGKYIEYQSDYSTIYESLKRSFPVIVRYLIGVFPIFLGFLFFGICVFWKSERFNSTSRASYTLFAMIQGDAIFDTFTDLSVVSYFLGEIYCYLFCIIFIIIVWNIFVSIIEEAYVVTKVKNKTSWIYNYLDLEPKLVDIKLHSKPSLIMTKKYFEKMEKSSEMLKRRISKSLRSNEILAGKIKESSSLDDKPFAKSISRSREGRNFGNNALGNQNLGNKPYFGVGVEESIPEKDEFDYRFREKYVDRTYGQGRDDSMSPLPVRRKYTFEGATDDKEKLVDGYFTKIENRLENIKNFSDELMKLIARRKSYSTYSNRKEIKEDLNIKVSNLELKAKELLQVWMRNY